RLSMRISTHPSMEENSNHSRSKNRDRFRNLFCEHHCESENRNEHGWNVNQRSPCEDIDTTGDSADCGRCDSIHERFHINILRVSPEIFSRYDHEEIARQKHTESCNRGAQRAGDDVADESYSYDDRPGRDHRDGNCIEELTLIQPVILPDDSSVEKGDNRQPAAKYEGTGLSKIEPDLPQRSG